MTENELSQLYYLDREIQQQKRRLRGLEATATNCSQAMTGMPHAPGVSDKVGRYAAKIADLKSLIEKNIEKSIAEKYSLEQYIQTISDSEMRQIIRLRFVEHKSWTKVAFSIGRYNEQYPRKKFNKFLKSTKSTNHS